jgi:tubulin monoglycylase TTLL3/8
MEVAETPPTELPADPPVAPPAPSESPRGTKEKEKENSRPDLSADSGSTTLQFNGVGRNSLSLMDSKLPSGSSSKFKDSHLRYIQDLAEKNRKEKEDKLKRAEADRKKREKLLKMVLGGKDVRSAVLSVPESSCSSVVAALDVEPSKKPSKPKTNVLRKSSDDHPHLVKHSKDKRDEKDEHAPKKVLLSTIDHEQLVQRLSQARKMPSSTIANMDIVIFRKKNGISEDTKIFQVVGGYPDIKKALSDRGWFFNADSHSPFYDYRFVLKAQDIDYGGLQKNQIVNHFQHNSELTSKIGLCRNVRNVSWFEDVDPDAFFPRCYDLTDPEQLESFDLDFKLTAAESIVRQYEFDCECGASQTTVAADVLASAMKVLEYRIHEMRNLCDDEDESVLPVVTRKALTEDDWKRILSYGSISTIKEEDIEKLREEALREGDHSDDDDDDDDDDYDESSDSSDSSKGPPPSARGNPKAAGSPTKQSSSSSSAVVAAAPVPMHALDRSSLPLVKTILSVIKQKSPQYNFNGRKNIWIVKPGRKSRGRGIQCFNNMSRLKQYTDTCQREFWVAQKYIENPLIVHRKKFDIRQWVIGMDYDPLSIFFYKRAYLRFCSTDFTLDDVENRVVHLANNCVQKHSKDFDSDDTFCGNMWHTDSFCEYLLQTYGSDIWNEKIQPAMKNIVRMSLKCGQDAVYGRKNSFELFGYDFMVDEDFNVWLIEINSSPDLSYSTPITEELVQAVSEDIAKVSVDWNCANRMQRKRGKKDAPDVDTGDFELIYRGEELGGCPIPSMASSLVITGSPAKPSKGSERRSAAASDSAAPTMKSCVVSLKL